MSRYFNVVTFVLLTIVLILIIVLIVIWKRQIMIDQRQQKEIQMYQMYGKPLEEFIRDLRARQHEFDNHINVLLNMHITIDTYDELVKAQSAYMSSLVARKENRYFPLLRISNKVIAGFLYSKLISINKDVRVELMVGSHEIFTNVPEQDIVEVIGTLIDNAVEASKEGSSCIKIFITSKEEKLIFVIKNQHKKIPISELTNFFERGYSTKEDALNRGLGLYNAKNIVKRWQGEIYVENELLENENYITFRVEL